MHAPGGHPARLDLRRRRGPRPLHLPRRGRRRAGPTPVVPQDGRAAQDQGARRPGTKFENCLISYRANHQV